MNEIEGGRMTVRELLEMVMHPDCTAYYIETLELIDELRVGDLRDKLNNIVGCDNGYQTAYLRALVDEAFETTVRGALKYHGIEVAMDSQLITMMILLNGIFKLGGYEDSKELLDVIDSEPDTELCIYRLVEIVSDIPACSMDTIIVYVVDAFIPNLRAYLNHDSGIAEEEYISDNTAKDIARNRLLSIPKDIAERSEMYRAIKDGYPLAFELDRDNHRMLLNILSKSDMPDDMINEVRIFLLASAIKDEGLMSRYSWILENMLPEKAMVKAMMVTQIKWLNHG